MRKADANTVAPVMLLTFGLGWLVGAEAAWYWGGLAIAGAIYWQYLNSKRGDKDPITTVPPEEDDD